MVGATLAALALWGAGPMEKLVPDTLPPGGATSAVVSLEAARGEHQPFQVAVRPPSDDLRNASLSVHLTGGAAGVTFEVRRIGHASHVSDSSSGACLPTSQGVHLVA